jgi:hypothetical protein
MAATAPAMGGAPLARAVMVGRAIRTPAAKLRLMGLMGPAMVLNKAPKMRVLGLLNKAPKMRMLGLLNKAPKMRMLGMIAPLGAKLRGFR